MTLVVSKRQDFRLFSQYNKSQSSRKRILVDANCSLTIMSSFDASTTIQQIADVYHDKLPGLTFLITGATGGLGLAFAKFIASRGAVVVITGRSEDRLKKSIDEIELSSSSYHINVKGILMDNADLSSIRRAAQEINDLGVKFNVLVNNAGISLVPFKLVNGCESQFAVNHLGHFLFTNLIVNCVKDGGRIVNISSRAHRRSPVRLDDINFDNGKVYDKWLAYAQSKSANILFAKSLSKKLKARGIESFSVHPGSIMSTGMALNVDWKVEGLQDENGKWKIPIVTEDQGIAIYLYTSLSPDIDGKGGAYLSECRIQDPLQPLTDDDADRLWEISNGLLGMEF
ncbi:hypothetical protein BDQ17DRAFT_1364112 [Cyathus striatus]|nr:hypothetical protein BDQ17DRAFT_1364112 [Cyathus striatus]